MLDYAIAFALGALCSGLVAFAMLPAVWARARRLVRRELETGIPISMAEVRAGRDLVRAEAALAIRRAEARSEEERDRRQAVMAESGRQSAEILALTETAQTRQTALDTLTTEAGQLRERIATLDGTIAAMRITLDERDAALAEGRRTLEATGMNADATRVELIATRTQLATAQDDLARAAREAAELVEAAIARDSRIALLTAEIATREAAIADRESRLAAAEARVGSLVAEIAQIRTSSERLTADLTRGADALREDWQVVESRLQTLQAERTALQADIARLKREAREGWEAVASDNQVLRLELTHLAADIAREARLRQSNAAPPLLAPANDDGSARRSLPPVPEDALAEGPPVG